MKYSLKKKNNIKGEIKMTNEEFRAKAKYVLDNEMFLENENLFNYEDLNSIKVAQIDSDRYIEALMPFMN
jgi:hypothetical protein